MALDLTSVVEDSITDTQLTDIPGDTSTPDTSVDTSTTDTSSDEVSSPAVTDDTVDSASDDPATDASAGDAAAQQLAPQEEDDFNKRFGLPPGQNNRIPFHRVKKIVEKNERDVTTKVTKQLAEQVRPVIQEYETKIKGYEENLNNVARFEQVMMNDPEQFLIMVSKIPAYKQFFDYIGQMTQVVEQLQQQDLPDQDPMPAPITLADGTAGYDEAGIRALTDWQARQVNAKVDARIKPIESTYQAQQQAARRQQAQQQYIAQLKPTIEKQINEARQWPNFNELEPQIVQLLASNPQMNLEGAYMKAYQSGVVPKLQTDRETLRKSLLQEIQKAPAGSTTVTTRQSRPGAQEPMTGRSIEEIVAASVGKMHR